MSAQRYEAETAAVGLQLYQNPDLRVKINYKHTFEIDYESFRFK